jgi:hypothetical protein
MTDNVINLMKPKDRMPAGWRRPNERCERRQVELPHYGGSVALDSLPTYMLVQRPDRIVLTITAEEVANRLFRAQP